MVAESTPGLESDLMAALLPVAVVAIERRHPGDPGELFDCERAAVVAAGPDRLHEFAAGRTCARQALRRLGHLPVPIGIGPDRAPQWPADVRGSITHCAGYAAAALAGRETVAAIGIDAEPAVPLPRDVAGVMLDHRERSEIPGSASRSTRQLWTLAIFSAKESVFKAHCSAGGGWLDPSDVHVELRSDGGFDAVVGNRSEASTGTDGLSGRTVGGRWSCADRLILTAVAVLAS